MSEVNLYRVDLPNGRSEHFDWYDEDRQKAYKLAKREHGKMIREDYVFDGEVVVADFTVTPGRVGHDGRRGRA